MTLVGIGIRLGETYGLQRRLATDFHRHRQKLIKKDTALAFLGLILTCFVYIMLALWDCTWKILQLVSCLPGEVQLLVTASAFFWIAF